jgi:hypothetical protein
MLASLAMGSVQILVRSRYWFGLDTGSVGIWVRSRYGTSLDEHIRPNQSHNITADRSHDPQFRTHKIPQKGLHILHVHRPEGLLQAELQR